MSTTTDTQPACSTKAVDLSRAFFDEVVKPILERRFPKVLAQAACGRFGCGSECLGMDDEVSRDHHWGPRIDMLLPERTFRQHGQRILKQVGKELPAEFRGFKLEAGHVGGAGLAPESLHSFLRRTIGRTSPPKTLADWLNIPEEDIIHVINGEVWHDPKGDFTSIRRKLEAYYPDPVWKRRIAHWCRYCSGMGLYAMQRAVLRKNETFAYTAFGRTLKLTIELAFLLNRRYFPYDKWLYPIFLRLPHLAKEMDPLIQRATKPATSWEERIELFERMHDMLDARMVALAIIRPHPKFQRSSTSGYRLLEHAYGELCQTQPKSVRGIIPLWDQKPMEEFHADEFVPGITLEAWDGMLNLKAQG